MHLLEALQTSAGFLWLSAFLLGLIIGSFLNVVILRLPQMMQQDWQTECRSLLELPEEKPAPRISLVSPRSACPKCGRGIRAHENIPVISYLFLRGRCAGCGTSISMQYPIVELLTGILTVAAAWRFGATPAALAAMLITWSLIALTVIDIRHQLLPDSITLPLLWVGLLVNTAGLFTDLQSAVIGAVAGYMSLWTVYQVFRLVTGKEGMGFGDFKLFAALGAWFGWQSLPLIILLSSVVGAVAGIVILSFAGKNNQTPLPFGPYLAGAGWIAMLWGDSLIRGYLQMSGMA